MYSEKGLRALFDKLYVPDGHVAWAPEMGKLKQMMKEHQRQQLLMDKLAAQADAIRATKEPEKISLKSRLEKKGKDSMSRRLADRAADVKRRSTVEWKEKRRQGILFLQDNAAYLAEKLHSNTDFTRRNPQMNRRSVEEVAEMDLPYFGKLGYLSRWEPGEDWPLIYDNREWTVGPYDMPPEEDSPVRLGEDGRPLVPRERIEREVRGLLVNRMRTPRGWDDD